MDLFQHRYYRLSKNLMMLLGQWPYQSTRAKRGLLAVFIIFTTSACVTVLPAVAKYRDDGKMLMECLIRYTFGTISVLKLLSFVVHEQKRLKLLNLIREHWQVWARDREVNILHEYADQGEKMAIAYTTMAYSSMIANMIQPLIPMIVDVLLKNGTGSKEFPYPIVYYNMDEQKYYFYLLIHANVCAGLLMTAIVSNDVILIIYVQHACGIFSALGHKLKRIGSHDVSEETGNSPHTVNKKDIVDLVSCINRHNDAIEYVNLIEASYTRNFFIAAGFGMILINVLGLQVLRVLGNPTATIRFLGSVFGILFYFFIECWVSQKLIDHSTSIRYSIQLQSTIMYVASVFWLALNLDSFKTQTNNHVIIIFATVGRRLYNSQWYRLMPKTQKLIQFMTMRSTVPCQLTAGKVMLLSVRSFWLVFKTAVSYFGFLRSTQGL